MDTQEWLEAEAGALGVTVDRIKAMVEMAAAINSTFGRGDAYDCLRALAIFDSCMYDLAEAMRNIASDMADFVNRMIASQPLRACRATPPQMELRSVFQPWQRAGTPMFGF